MTLPPLPETGFDRLVTERLVVRRFRDDDLATFAAYRSDPEVARYQSWSAPYPEDAARRFLASLAGEHPDTPGRWFQFAVEERATGGHIGDLAAWTDPDEPRVAHIGVTMSPAVQGRGYGREAVTALIDHHLVTRGKHRVVADCDPRNVASARLLASVGMRQEAHHVASYWDEAAGEWTDELVFAVLHDEWVERRAGVTRPG